MLGKQYDKKEIANPYAHNRLLEKIFINKICKLPRNSIDKNSVKGYVKY